MKKNVNSITVINIVSTLVLQGIAFLTTPIFTRMLGTEQYGIYSLFYSWMLIMTCVMGLNIGASIGTGYYTYRDRYINFRNCTLLFLTILCAIEFSLLYLTKNELSKVIGLDSGIVILIGISSFGHSVVNFAQSCFIYEKKAWSNFVLSVTVSISTVFLSIILISNSPASMKYMGRIVGMTIPYAVIAIIVWLILFKTKPVMLCKDYCKYAIVVGAPILFHSLSQLILGQSDRIMMQMMNIPSSEIGIYSFFYTLCAVLSTILGALNNSWCPFYYDDVSQEKWDILNKKCRNYIELFSVLSVGFLLLSREVSYVMADSSYQSGLKIIPILAFAVYFTFMYQFPVNFEFFYKKTNIIAIGTVSAGVLNIVLNRIMIPVWGMYGAAFATVISYMALFFAHYYIVGRMKEHKYHLSAKAFIPGLIGMIIGTVLFYSLANYWYVRWLLGVTLGCFELKRIFDRKTIF